jgi:hypothetical protein
MAYVPQIILERVQESLREMEDRDIREALERVEVFEGQLARARRHLVEMRNRRAKLARFLRENVASDDPQKD